MKYKNHIQFLSTLKKQETVTSVLEKIESDVWKRLQQPFGIAGYKMDYPHQIILLALKEEQKLIVYSDDFLGLRYIKEYPFTAFSGHLGPKLQEGDQQIPEGIYKIAHFNPNSAFYLSLKVDYPNPFDISKTKLPSVNEMGGEIFIHGKSSSVGCIAIGDKAIEEVFVLAHKAFNYPINVIISPWDFRSKPAYPEIDGIDWEKELYDQISTELFKLPKTN